MYLGLGLGLGFNPYGGNPLSTLTALVRDLGGYIFSPNQQNFADSSTLNATPSIFDSAVGYAGNVITQELPENFIANSEMVGATQSSLPTGWSATLTANGVTAIQTGYGTDADGTYLEFTFSGTAGGTASSMFVYPINTSSVVAYPGQLWSGDIKAKLVSGTGKPLQIILREVASGSLGTARAGNAVTPTNSLAVSSITARLTDVATTNVYSYVQISVGASSGVWNQVIRIYAPQLERGHPTNYTPTYGTVISRGVFAAAAQDTQNYKPVLRGKVVNYMRYSRDLSSAWTKRGICISTGGQIDRFGGNSAWRLDNLGIQGTNDLYIQTLAIFPNAPISPVFWIKPISTSGSIRFFNSQNANLYGSSILDLSTLTPGIFNRITLSHPGVTTSVPWVTNAITGAAGFGISSLNSTLISAIVDCFGIYLEASPIESDETYPIASSNTSIGTPNFWQFDGTDDYLITGIPTPSSGYMLSVFRQDEAIGGTNCLMGSAHTVTNSGVRLSITTSGYPTLTVFDGSGSTGAAQINSAIVIGTHYLADASWTPTSQKLRLNGVNESIGSATRNTASSGIFLIGASNSASDGGYTPNAFMQGMFGIQIIIPNVILPIETEARIRKLVGQIYGIQTQ